MGRLALAWRILTNSEFAQSISKLLDSRLLESPPPSPGRQQIQSPITSAPTEPPRNTRLML